MHVQKLIHISLLGLQCFWCVDHLFSQTPIQFSTQKSCTNCLLYTALYQRAWKWWCKLKTNDTNRKEKHGCDENRGSETACLGSNPGCHFLAVWCWDSYLTSLWSLIHRVVKRIKWVTECQGLRTCMAHSKHSTNISPMYYCPQRTVKRFIINEKVISISPPAIKNICTWGGK